MVRDWMQTKASLSCFDSCGVNWDKMVVSGLCYFQAILVVMNEYSINLADISLYIDLYILEFKCPFLN